MKKTIMIPWIGKVINVILKSQCQNIPKHSVIMIDNAPYHSKIRKITPLASGESKNLLIGLQKRT